jgi:3-hydroxyisobutyrate dehydrogenase-like beta-hydroxyacid dehydrogenase
MTPAADQAAVGLCGLGNMGGAIAGRLAAHGPAIAYDPDSSRLAEAVHRHGVIAAADTAHVATADTVVLSLPSPAVSQEVVTQLAPAMRPESVIVETSTLNPTDVWRMGETCAQHSVGLVDAAILSGVAQMEAGRATLLIGGEDAAIAAATPVLEALAHRPMRLGELGSGMAAKVVNNAVAHAVMVILAEAGALAAASGIPVRRLADLLADPEAGLMRPLTHRFVDRVLPGAYAGGMPTAAAHKDSMLALALAQERGVPLFGIQAAHTVYEIARSQGLSRQDYASIATLWERWTGRPLTEETAEQRPETPPA